jgi:putative FmdB family regulatory protein
MPTYEYRCPQGHQFELLQKMSQPARAKCPQCGKPAVRQISGGAGLIFKGTGFYITDYGKDGKGPRQDKETPSQAESAPAKPADGGKASEKPASADTSEKKDSSASSPADKPGKSSRKKSKS